MAGLDRRHTEVSSFDQLPEVLPGLETEPVQLSSGPLGLTVHGARGAGFSVARMSLTTRLADRSSQRQASVGFVLAEAPQVWCGLDIAPRTLVLLRPGRELRSILQPGFRSVEYFFAEHALADHPILRIIDGLEDTPEASVFPLDDPTYRRLEACTDAALNQSEQQNDQRISAEMIRDRQLDLLAEALSNGRPLPRCEHRRHYDLTSAALDLIDGQGPATFSAEGLAVRLGVTRRALEKAFKSVLSTSPGQYLLACRLTAVRERLIRTGGRIGDVAFANGFNDPSRFSFQYARLFGELPSVTVARVLN